jgi:anti-anti-sigma factor
VATRRPALRMSVQRTQDTAVLRLAGEADIADEQRLRLRLGQLVAGDGRPGVRHVVLETAELEFLDVSALGVLLEAAATLRARGGSLVVRCPTRRVRRLLTVLDVGLQVED